MDKNAAILSDWRMEVRPPGFVVPAEGLGPGHWLGDAVAYFFLKMQILFLAGVLNL